MANELTPLQHWAGVTNEHPLATLSVVFTDIVGSTQLTKSGGDREMFELLIKHFAAARRHSQRFNGFEIKLIGDAYMVAFKSASIALSFVLSFRRDTGDERIRIRAGISSGQVRILNDDIYGLMVNHASRLSHVKLSRFPDGIFANPAAHESIKAEWGETAEFRMVRQQRTDIQDFADELFYLIIPAPPPREVIIRARPPA